MLCAVACLGPAACDSEDSAPSPEPALSAPSQADRALDDRSIELAVERKLRQDAAASVDWLDLQAKQGVLTLSGTAASLVAVRRAAALAGTVRGVRSVVSLVEVVPATIDDAQLQLDVREALRQHRVGKAGEITVSARGQVVALDGRVDTAGHKMQAERVVEAVRGVREVHNNLTVRHHQRPDAELRADVITAVRWNALVDDSLINVAVRDGHVTLTGRVGLEAEKRQAIESSRLPGVVSVDAGGLHVTPQAMRAELRAGKYEPRTGDQVREAVVERLAGDPRVMAEFIEVQVDGARVTLRGKVGDLSSKLAAELVAEQTVGVTQVKNHIRVRPPPLPGDGAQQVERALQRDAYLNGRAIVVRAEAGHVFLDGTVDTHLERRTATMVAARVSGVTDVTNELEVSSSRDRLVESPYVSEAPLDETDAQAAKPQASTLSDAGLRDSIEDLLWWNAFVDAADVDVSVENGVATLSGRVDSTAERQAAIESALAGGAAWVLNELQV